MKPGEIKKIIKHLFRFFGLKVKGIEDINRLQCYRSESERQIKPIAPLKNVPGRSLRTSVNPERKHMTTLFEKLGGKAAVDLLISFMTEF